MIEASESSARRPSVLGHRLGILGIVPVYVCLVMAASGYGGTEGRSGGQFHGRHELIVDGFNTPLARLEAVDADGVFPVTAGATAQGKMIGEEFDVQVQLRGTQSPGARAWLEVADGLLHYRQEPGTTASALWHYDGNDADPGTVHASTGLGGIDLTRGGALDRLAVKVLNNAVAIDLSFVLFSDANNASEITKMVPATDRPGTVWFPFSEFTVSKGSGADPTSITAILAVLGAGGFTGAADISLGCIATTPDPAAPRVLYDQLGHQASTTIYSLNFPGANPFDAQAGDDFTVPPGKNWHIGGLRFSATYSPGPPTNPTADITFFVDNAGMLGMELFREAGVEMSGTHLANLWEARLSEPYELSEGTYWVAIQGNVPIGTEMRIRESKTLAGAPYYFRNPGGALTPDCTDWKIGSLCLGVEASLAFSLLGPAPAGGGKANDDCYECFGNTGISVPASRGLLVNDALGAGEVVGFDAVTSNSAAVYVATDGAFTYTPRRGFVGDDAFTYRRADGSEATVHISVRRSVWFINNDPQVAARSANEGTVTDPFVSLGAYNASSASRPGDIAFFYPGTYTGSLSLRDGQIVASKVDAFLTESPGRWGGYDSDSLNLPASFVFPQVPATIQSVNGDAITLAKDNMLIGVNVGTATGGYAVQGHDFGRLTLFGVTVAGPGEGVHLQNGCLDAKYADISSSDAAGPALQWSFGGVAPDTNDTTPREQRSGGFALNLAGCNVSGPNGGVDARVFGSASAALVATDNVISGGTGIGFAVTSQDNSTLSVTLTGNDVKGQVCDIWLTQEDDSIFTLPGFTGSESATAVTFVQDNNIGNPSVFTTGNIPF
jgi:hypothetical protein